MIRITCGTCGTSRGYKTQADGALTLPAAEEQRLVRRGVAEYATRPIIGNGADSPVEDGDGGGYRPVRRGPARGRAGKRRGRI